MAFVRPAFLAAFVAMASAAAAQPPAEPQPHHAHPPPAPQAPAGPPVASQPSHDAPAEASTEAPNEPIPPLTDEDRAAAFPPGLDGHTVHDKRFNAFVLFDRLEWQGAGAGGAIENTSWIGGDINRLWIRAEAEADEGRLEDTSVEALYGRSVSRWWDVVGGVRQDVQPGDPQTWAAIGVQGLAPYWFEIQATAYVGTDAGTRARFEAEYDLLLTNRLILQPLFEFDLYGKRDPARGVGAGLTSFEAGLRLRYEIRRELAPYLGVVWDRRLFGTADLARENGESVASAKLALGVRTWF